MLLEMGGAVQLSFDFEIDYEATARKTDRFLERDLERCLRYSGKHRTDLASPKFDATGAAGSHDNTVELKVVRGLDAEAIVQAVALTIDNCSSSGRQPFKQILVARYIHQLPEWAVAEKIGYSTARTRVLKRQALNEFADRFEFYQKKFKIAPIELHILKN